MNYAQKVFEFTQSIGINDNQLSLRTGIPSSLISNWRTGKKQPGIASLRKISLEFNEPITRFTEENSSEDKVPEEFVLMARKMGDISEDQRKRIYKILDSTIDTVLEALKDEQSKK